MRRLLAVLLMIGLAAGVSFATLLADQGGHFRAALAFEREHAETVKRHVLILNRAQRRPRWPPD